MKIKKFEKQNIKNPHTKAIFPHPYLQHLFPAFIYQSCTIFLICFVQTNKFCLDILTWMVKYAILITSKRE